MRIRTMLLQILVAAMLLAVLITSSFAATLQGRVVGVHDGDTVTVLDASRHQVKVRLAEIDAPETNQPYGNRARQALADLVFGRDVRVDTQAQDRYGRTVGRIYSNNVDVNAALVAQGAAWVYRQYAHDPALLRLEAQAQAAHRGLWALPASQRIPPWEWRRTERERRMRQHGDGQASTRTTPALPSSANMSHYSCSTRKSCSQMSNCAEARYYLNQCGQTQLDGNHDGIPCNSLCRR